jgi:hypothetical protein
MPNLYVCKPRGQGAILCAILPWQICEEIAEKAHATYLDRNSRGCRRAVTKSVLEESSNAATMVPICWVIKPPQTGTLAAAHNTIHVRKIEAVA